MKAPGKLLGDPFYIQVTHPFKKGDVLSAEGYSLLIIKTYHHTWWRKILSKFGLKLKPLYTYKVKVR